MSDPITSGFESSELMSAQSSRSPALLKTTKDRLEVLRARIGLGVTALNRRYGEQWPLRIKTARIDFRSARMCVLGQLTLGYLTGLKELGIEQREAHLFGLNVEYAEEWDVLSALWAERVETLRSTIGMEA